MGANEVYTSALSNAHVDDLDATVLQLAEVQTVWISKALLATADNRDGRRRHAFTH